MTHPFATLFVLAALLVSPCSGTFLYSDKIAVAFGRKLAPGGMY